jgi:predicted transcriptional regulator of viral defense system
VTERPALRAIKNKKLKINFFVKKEWLDEDVIQKKTDSGYINVSSPELTALDLLYYLETIGLNRALTILQELSTEIKVTNLVKVAKRYPQTVAIQRLGYLLDKELHHHKFAEPLLKVLNDRKYFPASLSLSKNSGGEIDSQWKVIKNAIPDSDL